MYGQGSSGQSGPGQPGQQPYGQPGAGGPGGPGGPRDPWGRPMGPPPGWGPPPQAPKPGVVPLRPLGLGEILDGAISYIRRNPRATLGLAAVLSTASALVQFLLLAATAPGLTSALNSSLDSVSGDLTFDAGASLTANLATLVSAGVGFFIGIIATGVFTVVMGAAVLGRDLEAGRAWAITRRRLWPLIGLTLLTTLAVLGVAAVVFAAAVPLVMALGAIGGLLAFVIVLVGLAFAVWLSISLVLSPAVLMLEQVGVLAAWRRSIGLVRGAWWRTFGIYLLASIIAGLIGAVLTIPFSLIGAIGLASAGPGEVPWLTLALTTLGSLVAGIITLPFSAGVVALLYVDIRMRREGLDLRLTAATGTAATTGFPAPDWGGSSGPGAPSMAGRAHSDDDPLIPYAP